MFEPTDVHSMEEVAVLMHEHYLDLKKAGFTQHEVWHILLAKVDCDRKNCPRR